MLTNNNTMEVTKTKGKIIIITKIIKISKEKTKSTTIFIKQNYVLCFKLAPVSKVANVIMLTRSQKLETSLPFTKQKSVKILLKEHVQMEIIVILLMEKTSFEAPKTSTKPLYVLHLNKPEIVKKDQNVNTLMDIKSLGQHLTENNNNL
mmetsp:Transcript_64633/g.97383  ORF Transcript_64633/g.97383 Transcript_64633/m.97383 type:complete len:149 (+) Transcript_64633:50-496(+)